MKKIILSTLIVIGVIASASAQIGTTLTNGLIAFYPFKGDFNDRSGNSNNLTQITEGITFGTNRFGCPNSSINISTTNDYLQSANEIGLNGNPNFTESFWYKFNSDAGPNSGSVISFGSENGNGTGNGISIYSSGFYNWGSSDDFAYYFPVTLNAWHHFVVTYSGLITGTQVYMDGVLVSSNAGFHAIQLNTSSYNFSPSALTIGSPHSWMYQYGFVGSIDDVRIYSRTLSSNEVLALYKYESDLGAQWLSYLSQNLPTNSAFFSALAANTNFVSALATSITSSPSAYGILQQGPQGPQGIQGIQGPAGKNGTSGAVGATGTFDPTVLTNTAFLTGLASNPVFLNAISTQILSGSNNYGIAVKQTQSLNFPAIATLTITPGKKFTNTVTASTALPVTQIVGNTAIAAVSNNVLTILGAGSTTVTVSQAGNALYNPATASQPLIVNKGAQTLAFTAIP